MPSTVAAEHPDVATALLDPIEPSILDRWRLAHAELRLRGGERLRHGVKWILASGVAEQIALGLDRTRPSAYWTSAKSSHLAPPASLPLVGSKRGIRQCRVTRSWPLASTL